MSKIEEFLESLSDEGLSNCEIGIRILWWQSEFSEEPSLSAGEICKIMENNHFPRQNAHRMASQLSRDKRVTKKRDSRFVLTSAARRALSSDLSHIVTIPKQYDGVILPNDLVAGTRGYLEIIANQINGSYQAKLWDCCAVMCRRLAETLLIEAYDGLGKSDDIIDVQGNYLALDSIISKAVSSEGLGLSRDSKSELPKIKSLGDKSAHSRRFCAKSHDIEQIRPGFRACSEELLRIAGLL